MQYTLKYICINMPTFEAKMAPGYLLVVAGVKWVLWPKSHWNFRSKTNDCVPDYVSWHFPGYGNPWACAFVVQAANVREMIRELGLKVKGIQVNEYGFCDKETTGDLLYSLCQIERAKLDFAIHSCWDDVCWSGRINGLLTRDQRPTGKWHVYERYARLAGSIVQTKPAGQLELVASRDDRQVAVLFGSREKLDTVDLRFTNLSRGPVAGGKVHVFAELITATGGTEPCPPNHIRTVLDQEVSVQGDR